MKLLKWVDSSYKVAEASTFPHHPFVSDICNTFSLLLHLPSIYLRASPIPKYMFLKMYKHFKILIWTLCYKALRFCQMCCIMYPNKCLVSPNSFAPLKFHLCFTYSTLKPRKPLETAWPVKESTSQELYLLGKWYRKIWQTLFVFSVGERTRHRAMHTHQGRMIYKSSITTSPSHWDTEQGRQLLSPWPQPNTYPEAGMVMAMRWVSSAEFRRNPLDYRLLSLKILSFSFILKTRSLFWRKGSFLLKRVCS
jgi:hypothetical protein